MFGYVTVDKPNMLIKDFAEYKAYYCGLCKTLGKSYSQLMRFSINFDITFLTLIAHNYCNQKPVISLGHCITHPVGKKFSIVENNPIQERIADINVILGYYKVLDDVLDNGKAKYRAAKAYFTPKFKKAAKNYPELAKAVKISYDNLRVLEKAKETSLDKLCDCFATLLVEVGKTASSDKTDDNLEELCYNLGKWIYLIDAYDDLKKDLSEKKFNPLAPDGNLSLEKEEELNQKVGDELVFCIKNIRSAYDKMNITISEGPLSNIVYCGLMARTNTILSGRGEKCRKTLL